MKKFYIDSRNSEKYLDKLLILLFTLINALVLFNASFHEPTIGYDYEYHSQYIETLTELRLPTSSDTEEFFSPPLPYAFPAFLMRFGSYELWWAVKFAQLLNVLLSVVLTFYLLKICELISPSDRFLKLASLLFLGILPVYYKTFVFVRGEPFVACLSLLVIYLTLQIFVKNVQKTRYLVALGVTMGLIVLSRQWGFLLFPAIIVFVGCLALRNKEQRWWCLKVLLTSLVISFVVGSWFYLNLLREYGSLTAFNRSPTAQFSFFNQSTNFYLGLGRDDIFKDPIRNAFPNQAIPIFYSEIWGDYWSYFVVYGKDTQTDLFIAGKALEKIVSKVPIPDSIETNRHQANLYLGRVNLLSLFPSALFLGGILLGLLHLRRFIFVGTLTTQTAAFSLFTLLIITSLTGYLWFLIRYPNFNKGDTLKATYMIQIFPFMAILTAALLKTIDQKSRPLSTLIIFLIVIILLHNLPAMTTHYTNFPPNPLHLFLGR